ncbi:hypothetical protein ACFFIY_13640 [Bhargavaea ullalensis]|uniref:YrhC-like protein n=1 Tax=Bhargavaea ullalensis TaxID=1265685 RepID=A0ABV2G8A8_9BACL
MKGDFKIRYRDLDTKDKFIRSIWGGAFSLAFLYWVISVATGVEGNRDFDNVYIKVWLPLVATFIVVGDVVYMYTKWKKEEKSKQ